MTTLRVKMLYWPRKGATLNEEDLVKVASITPLDPSKELLYKPSTGELIVSDTAPGSPPRQSNAQSAALYRFIAVVVALIIIVLAFAFVPISAPEIRLGLGGLFAALVLAAEEYLKTNAGHN